MIIILYTVYTIKKERDKQMKELARIDQENYRHLNSIKRAIDGNEVVEYENTFTVTEERIERAIRIAKEYNGTEHEVLDIYQILDIEDKGYTIRQTYLDFDSSYLYLARSLEGMGWAEDEVADIMDEYGYTADDTLHLISLFGNI